MTLAIHQTGRRYSSQSELSVNWCSRFNTRIKSSVTYKCSLQAIGTATQYKLLGKKPYFLQIRQYNTNLQENSNITLCSSITYKGTDYNPKYFLFQNDEIFQISEILYFHDNDLILFACTKHSPTFEKHFNSYSVAFNTESSQVLLNIDSFTYFPMNVHSLGTKKYCRPKCI